MQQQQPPVDVTHGTTDNGVVAATGLKFAAATTAVL